MKSRASGIWEDFEGRPSRTMRELKGEKEEKDGLALCPVWTWTGLWGVLVYAGGSGDGARGFVASVATVLGLSVDRESLHDEVGALRGRIAASEKEREPSERYVAIGQLAVHSYKEIEAILGAVIGELRKTAMRGKSEGEEECLEELERGRDLVREQIELAKLEMPVLRMADLNELVQACVREQEDRVHSKGLRLMKRLGGGLPKLLLDAEKVKVAVAKVMAAAAARSVSEGWLRVETGQQDGDVVLQVTWEEKGAPGGGCEDMFLPFGRLDKGGMGLLVASQIIREHGGGVRVSRFQNGTSALILDFPVRDNQDRRRVACRRSGLDRRRIE
jgi:signal transduction histidine kinase